MTNTMTKEERLQSIIDTMDEWNIIQMWNDRCDSYSDFEDRIYYMTEIDDIFGKMWASEFLDKFDRDFDGTDEFFRDGIRGLESFSDIYDVVDNGELIEYIIDEDEDFGDDRIREVLDSEDEEDEEDED